MEIGEKTKDKFKGEVRREEDRRGNMEGREEERNRDEEKKGVVGEGAK